MNRLTLLALAACIAFASAGCAGRRRKDPNAVEITFGRNYNAKACGALEFGPCGRPKSNVKIDIGSSGDTNINGNAFQALETQGRLAEIMKLVGNRFKPEVECPPRPPSNIDTSAEGICAQRTIRRKPGNPSGRRRGKYSCGSGNGSPHGGVGASSDESSGFNGDVTADAFEGDNDQYAYGHGGAGGYYRGSGGRGRGGSCGGRGGSGGQGRGGSGGQGRGGSGGRGHHGKKSCGCSH